MESDQELAQKIARYTPSKTALEQVRQVPLLLAVGITAAGKDTVLRRLLDLYPDDYRFTVSHTTRAIRVNDGVPEEHGVKYYFIDKPTAAQMLDDGQFVETNYFASNLYGTSIAELERSQVSNRILISDIDVNGIGNFVRLGLNVKPVFLLPPSFQVWQQRLHARHEGEFNTDDLRQRLQTALAELQNALDNDYFYILINDDLDRTVARVNDIAHGKQVAARPPEAVALAQQLADQISAEIAKLKT